VIPVALAIRLRAAGLAWKPASGDRFVLPDRELDDVFVLSDMTVSVHRLPEGTVIGFNGTTEWALDDVDQDEAVWLPAEDQLRERLGPSFQRLERTPDGFAVVVATPAGTDRFSSDGAEAAYALALLATLGPG
jgi:hypothetical protein